MSCLVVIVAALSFLGGTLLGMHRSKLKFRYMFAAMATLTVILGYLFLPTCAIGGDNLPREAYGGKLVQRYRPKLLNGRELLNNVDSRTFRDPAKAQISRAKNLARNYGAKADNKVGKQNDESWLDGRDYEEERTTAPSPVVVNLGLVDRKQETEEDESLIKESYDEDAQEEEEPDIGREDDEEGDDEEEVKVVDVEDENAEEMNFDEMGIVDMNEPEGTKLPSPKQLDSDEDMPDRGDGYQEDRRPHNKRTDVTKLYSNITLDDEFRRRYLVELEDNEAVVLAHLTPTEAKVKYSGVLPWWEVSELGHYPRIWFVGETANKTRYNESNPWNYGFDYASDDSHEGRYIIVKGDHIEYRYKIVHKLGAGSFGAAVLAEDMAVPTNHPHRMVAVKIMHNDSSVEKYFKKELDITRHIMQETRAPDRYSKILRSFFFRNHLCIVFELLGEVLDEKTEGPITDLVILQKYARDILTSIALLHKKNIIHGDLKPDNIMFARGCNMSCPVYVKVADFGLACVPNSKKFPCPGRYFQTRHYRSPEVILDLDYDGTADMWSLGVILARLYMDKVPFYGESTTDQLAAIMEVMGLVPPYMVEESPRIRTYQKALCYVCENGFKRRPYRKTLPGVLKGMPAVLYDFIEKCFILDYQKRMTSEQALRHPFITGRFKEKAQGRKS